jgi:DNA-directed RNA polymerase subunit H (RpoH/RPB5)
MTTSNNRILSIYKSRKTIMEFMDYQDYDISEYENFNINEIDAMYSSDQLDMLFTNKKNNSKTYIKYYLTSKQIRPANLDKIIEDLFSIENILTTKDTLIIIIEDEPNDTIIKKLKYLYDHDGIFVIIHNINRLQYNILRHTLVPDCSILSKEDIEELKKKFNITNNSQFPEISRFDPQSLAIGLRPGQICKFTRKSITALESEYYRICVQ